MAWEVFLRNLANWLNGWFHRFAAEEWIGSMVNPLNQFYVLIAPANPDTVERVKRLKDSVWASPWLDKAKWTSVWISPSALTGKSVDGSHGRLARTKIFTSKLTNRQVRKITSNREMNSGKVDTTWLGHPSVRQDYKVTKIIFVCRSGPDPKYCGPNFRFPPSLGGEQKLTASRLASELV